MIPFYLLGKSYTSTANNPETTAPEGDASVQVDSDVLVVPNEGSGNYRWYGRSSMRQLSDGTWVHIYNNAAAHTDTRYSQLRIQFSDDYGATWTAKDTDLDGNPVSGFPLYPPNAVPSTDPEGPGEGWLIQCPNGDLLISMWHTNGFAAGAAENGMYQSRSTDNGKTWSAPVAVDIQGTTRENYIFATDDDFVYAGDIYLAAREYAASAESAGTINILLKSSDNGATWTKISEMNNGDTHPSIEVGIEYVGNNTIIGILRGVDGTGCYGTWLVKSTDMGATWSTPTAPTNLQVTGRIRIKTRSHAKGKNNWWQDPVLIAHGHRAPNAPACTPRTLTVYISKDFGETWSAYLDLRVQGFDGGYGDFLWNPNTQQYVTMQYYAPTSYYDGEIRQINWKLNFV